ncbi:hypothetical protein EMIT0P260_120099 [Pseudomonas sp. IT-P260]
MTPSLFFARACWQWRSPQLSVLNPTVGAGLPAMTAHKPTNLSTECTQSNCGSEPARESGLPDDIKTTGAIPVLHTHTHHKRTPATTFKVHEPLRHTGYNALRRYLRVRQNPPAYTAMGRAISFPCH